jgi:hypothetical protein
VAYPLEQGRAVDDVEGPLRNGDGAQVAGYHVVVSTARVEQHLPGERLVAVDGGDRDLKPALGELGDAELAQRGQAARLEHADRSAEALQYVLAHRLGEEPGRRPLPVWRASFGSRHASHGS